MKEKKQKSSSINLIAQIVGFLTAAFFLTYGLLESFGEKEPWYGGLVEAIIFGGSVLIFVTMATRWSLTGAIFLIAESIFIALFPLIRLGTFYPTSLIVPLPIFTSGLLFLIDHFKTYEKKEK